MWLHVWRCIGWLLAILAAMLLAIPFPAVPASIENMSGLLIGVGLVAGFEFTWRSKFRVGVTVSLLVLPAVYLLSIWIYPFVVDNFCGDVCIVRVANSFGVDGEGAEVLRAYLIFVSLVLVLYLLGWLTVLCRKRVIS